MKTIIVFFTSLFISIAIYAQKQTLNHDVYDSWKSIESFKLSVDGRFSAYQINPQKNDGNLYLIDNAGGETLKVFPRAVNHKFSASSNFIVFKVIAQEDTIRKLKVAKKKKDTYPKDSLFIYSINSDTLVKISRLKSYKIATEEQDVICFLHEKEEADTSSSDTEIIDSISQDKPEIEGSKLILWNLTTNISAEYDNVCEYILSENGSLLIIKSEYKDSIDSVGIFIINPISFKKQEILHEAAYVKGMVVDKTGSRFAFYYSQDTTEIKEWTIKIIETDDLYNSEISSSLVAKMPIDWEISKNYKLAFTEDANKLYFGTSFVLPDINNDSIPEDEIVNLDIWSWNDSRIQSHQISSLSRDKNKTFAAVYNFETEKAIQLADSSMDIVRLKTKGQNMIALGHTNIPYQDKIQWSVESFRDYFIVNTANGKKSIVAENFTGTVSLAPGGKFAAIYDKRDSTWYIYDVRQKISYPISPKEDIEFFNDKREIPQIPASYGIAGWLKNDRALVVYDEFDLWLQTCGKNGEVENITKSFGRDNNTVLRYYRTDFDKQYIDENENILIKGFNKTTKSNSLYFLDIKTGLLTLLIDLPYKIGGITKAKEKEFYVYSKSDYETYPDRYVVKDMNDWNNCTKISDCNPQIEDYSWGSAELYQWIDFNGDTVSGLLYKPENFNSADKYPMIVYFYERYSDGLYNHFTPKPSRSVINFPLYTSNGYIVFIPDIHYKLGQPGKDAYNSIVSGTFSLIEKGFVDKDKIGLQGQSWGGYQVAHLITQTDLYCCAMAGAPVSNMTSAYGGVRYASGQSRMMQYEQGQSRIGATLWEDLPAYIENSSVFFADKINTPLLIMHNDGDGAVPFTQGVELFLAMKRLNKPAWLLNYNDEEHNLSKRANCVDLSIRMKQFFDYYLQNQDCPEWLDVGVPAIKKGLY